MDFGVCAPTASRTSAFGAQMKTSTPSQAAKELLKVKVQQNQIVEVLVPFNTSRAKDIRMFLATYMKGPDGQRLLIFRAMPVAAWTNIHLNSTPEAPMLTMEPIKFCEKLLEISPVCDAISTVTFEDDEGTPLSMTDVRKMKFKPLEESAAKTDVREVLVSEKTSIKVKEETSVKVSTDELMLKLKQVGEEILFKVMCVQSSTDSMALDVHRIISHLGVAMPKSREKKLPFEQSAEKAPVAATTSAASSSSAACDAPLAGSGFASVVQSLPDTPTNAESRAGDAPSPATPTTAVASRKRVKTAKVA